MGANFQRISKTYDSDFEIAKKYYTVIFGLNDIHLTNNELNLIAFSAVNGTISTPPIKQQFIEEFNVPQASIYNMIAKLKKLDIFVKGEDLKVRINPIILPDFSERSDLVLVIKILKDGTA